MKALVAAVVVAAALGVAFGPVGFAVVPAIAILSVTGVLYHLVAKFDNPRRIILWWLRLGKALRGSGWPFAWVIWPHPVRGGATFQVASNYQLRSYEAREGGATLAAKVGGCEEARITSTKIANLYQITLIARSALAELVRLPPLQLGSASKKIFFGRAEDGRDLTWNIVSDAGHGVIQGRTRSGKSVMAYGLLMQLAHLADVRVTGIDPNRVLDKPWGEGEWVAGISDMESITEFCEKHVEELDRRLALLGEREVDKLGEGDFGPDLPVEVVILEEYAGLMSAAKTDDDREGRKPADRLKGRIESALGRLTAEGAKVGFRLIFILQRAEAAIINSTMRSNAAIRISFAVDDTTSASMLHQGMDADQLKLVKSFSAGVGFFEMQGVPAVRFRAAYFDGGGYQEYLRAVRSGRDAARIASGDWPHELDAPPRIPGGDQ